MIRTSGSQWTTNWVSELVYLYVWLPMGNWVNRRFRGARCPYCKSK